MLEKPNDKSIELMNNKERRYVEFAEIISKLDRNGLDRMLHYTSFILMKGEKNTKEYWLEYFSTEERSLKIAD